MGAKSLAAWLVYFLGGRGGLRVALGELRALGLDSMALYSPLACECCGTEAAGVSWDNPGVVQGVSNVHRPGGEYLRIVRYHNGRVRLQYDNPLCAGEAMLLGQGKGGECNCQP